MADEKATLSEIDAAPFFLRLFDNGDGTYSLAVSESGSSSGGATAVEQGSLTDGSGTITTGGTSQEVFAANTSRRYLLIQNVSAEDLWVQFGGAAVQDQPSVKLGPSDALIFDGSFIPTEQAQIIGATTGSEFTAKEA